MKQCETLLATIDEITQLSQLRSFRHQFQQALEQSHDMHDTVRTYEVINSMHDRLIKRSIQLVEERMIGEGLGPPPSPYCYLLLGSGGRQEQTFGSDQDSALIYAEPNSGDREKRQQYFMQLADRIVVALEGLGYSPCDGKVQSNVTMWCKSTVEWSSQIKDWIAEADWESIRYLLICADARAVFGHMELFDRARDDFYSQIHQAPHIYQRMIDNTVHHRVMVNVFGQLLTVKYGEQYGSIDIKYGAYIPFVNAIRWFAIRHNIKSTSTLNRLEQLYINKHFDDEQYLKYRKGFILFLSLRLKAGYEEYLDYYEGSHFIHPKKLPKEEVSALKRSLQVGRKLQKHIQYVIRQSR